MVTARLLRLLPSAALVTCAALLVVLAQKNRSLAQAYRDLRRRAVLPYAGYEVPAFTTTSLAGARVTIGHTDRPEGRQVLFILTTTCPYCRATLPVWKQIADSLRRISGPPIQVYAISLDSAHVTRAYADSFRLTFPALLFPQPKLRQLYRAVAVPQTVVLNGSGRVLYAKTGLLDASAVLDSVYRAVTSSPGGETKVAQRDPGGP
jgi:peroxiredoxin